MTVTMGKTYACVLESWTDAGVPKRPLHDWNPELPHLLQWIFDPRWQLRFEKAQNWNLETTLRKLRNLSYTVSLSMAIATEAPEISWHQESELLQCKRKSLKPDHSSWDLSRWVRSDRSEPPPPCREWATCWEVNSTLLGFFSSAPLQYPRP